MEMAIILQSETIRVRKTKHHEELDAWKLIDSPMYLTPIFAERSPILSRVLFHDDDSAVSSPLMNVDARFSPPARSSASRRIDRLCREHERR